MELKKLFTKGLITCALLTSGAQANAQISLGNILKQVSSSMGNKEQSKDSSSDDNKGGLLSNLTNIFSNSKVATKDKIIGTWIYEEPAVVMSSDNTLENIGGKLATSAIEDKLNTKLEKYGLKKGSVKMTFDKEGNFTQTIMKKQLKGTYTINGKNIILKYGGKVSQIAGTTQLDGNNLLIVMDATKLLKYVNMLGSVMKDSALKTATSLIGNMDGLECGLKLVKE